MRFFLQIFFKGLIPVSVFFFAVPLEGELLLQWQGHPQNHCDPQGELDCHLQRQ